MYYNIPKVIVPKVIKIALFVWVFNQENIYNSLFQRMSIVMVTNDMVHFGSLEFEIQLVD